MPRAAHPGYPGNSECLSRHRVPMILSLSPLYIWETEVPVRGGGGLVKVTAPALQPRSA